MSSLALGTLIFVLVYVLIIVEKWHKTVVALTGASLVLLLKLVSQEEAFHSKEFGVDWNVIFLLIGMMIIVSIMRETGVFEWTAIKSAKMGKGEPFRIMVIFAVVTAVVSAFLDNVTTVLLIAPVTIAVAKQLEVDPVPYLIVGVLGTKGATGFGDQDDVVIVPVSTFRAKLQGALPQFIGGSIQVSAVSSEDARATEAQLGELLRARHRIREGQPDDFSVRNLAELATAQREGAQTMTSLLAGIALVSLVVGGIGIMNIMLVSVTERTREIGLRMAVGAKPRSILTQFLVEAVALSVAGGILGTAGGLATAAWLAARFEWPMLVQPPTVALAVVFSAVVGVVFGMWPALKASRLDPIQALRYE